MSDDYIERYDASKAPKPDLWLLLDEQEAVQLVEEYHRRAHFSAPNDLLHAMIHVVVENQIAMGEETPKRVLARLRRERLSRHDAIHAIGNVLAIYMHELISTTREDESDATSIDVNARYHAELERLTAKAWLNQTL